MSKSSLILILISLLILSLAGNLLLLNKAINYYKMYKISTVRPLNNLYYSESNRQLPAKTGRKRVILFGDSRIKEWDELPAQNGYTFINRGLSGETTAQMRARFATDVLGLNPDIVIIQAGINDIVAAAQIKKETAKILDECITNIEYFINTLQEHNIKVIYTTIIPPANPGIDRWLVWDDSIKDNVENVNRIILEHNKKNNIYVINTKELLMDNYGVWRQGVNKDTLHLTRKGYTILNSALSDLLEYKSDAF